MFICKKHQKSLSAKGKEWPWGRSYGPCEVCERVDECLDVPSYADWAWKPITRKSGSKKGRKMRNDTFRLGNTVKVGFDSEIPVRYQGRTATVVGRSRVGRGFRYSVSFGDRRVTPLSLSKTQLTLVG